MIPGLEDWRNRVTAIVSSDYVIQPSEFWRMDLNELNFWFDTVKVINDAIARKVKNNGR